MLKIFAMGLVFAAGFALGPPLGQAQRGAGIAPQNYGFTHHGQVQPRGSLRQHPRVLPAPRNLPLYNPYFSHNFGPLYEPYDEPCHYDEEYGIWVGPCNTSLDTPGYSITVPNRIRR